MFGGVAERVAFGCEEDTFNCVESVVDTTVTVEVVCVES